MVLLEVGGTKKADRVGDVIFVHGLNGDAKKSWSHNATEEGFWPNWLAKDRSTLGIWSVGYNVAASGWRGNAMPLFDRANNILAELAAIGIGTKPICFITHSMGGLLVKYMLRNAHTLAPEFRVFSQMVHGVIFLATPHTGSDLATLVNYLKFFLRPTVAIKELEHAAPALRDLNLWYRQNADHLKIRTQVYFETQKTNNVQVVDAVSADPGIKDVVPIGIDADHIMIVKPSFQESLVYLRSRQFVDQVLLTLTEDQALHQTASIVNSNDPRPFLVPPLPPQGVVGRDKELDDIARLLVLSESNVTDVPPVVLRGMGGIGKTTLAIALGRRKSVRRFFPDGVLWTALGPHPTILMLLRAWGRIGVHP